MHARTFSHFLFAGILLLFSAEASGAEGDSDRQDANVQTVSRPSVRSAELSARTGLRFDNNAFLDRRGQYGADAVSHLVGLLGVSGTFQTQFTGWLAFTLDTNVETEELRIDLDEGSVTNELRKTTYNLDPVLAFTIHEDLEISLKPSMRIVRESNHAWSFLQASPSLEFSYVTPFELFATLNYTFTGKFFDTDEPTNTYGNVDMKSHRGDLSLRYWPAPRLRARLNAGIEHQEYGKNIGESLGRIVFLPIEEFGNPDAAFTPTRRTDRKIDGELEIMVVPFEWGLVAAGYRFEDVSSGFDTFTYRGHGPRLALAGLYKGHEAYVEGKLTFNDFHDFRFDTRFNDTRKDYSLDLYAVYGWSIRPWVKVNLIYSFVRNDSNDAAYFTYGNSRSYSLYQRSRVELALTFRTDFIQEPEVPAPPDIPGTILAEERRYK